MLCKARGEESHVSLDLIRMSDTAAVPTILNCVKYQPGANALNQLFISPHTRSGPQQ